MSDSLDGVQAEVGEWQRRTWPDNQDPVTKALKFAEEAGEVAGAVIKMLEGRKTQGDLANEIGDSIIALAGLAEVADINLATAVVARWSSVRERRYASNGGDPS